MAEFIGHYPCEKCGSSNNLAKYSDGSWFCFSYCGNKSLSEDYKEEHNIKDRKVQKPKLTPEQKEFMKDNITEEEQLEIKEKTQKESYGYRSISDEVNNFYGCRTEVGPNDEVLARYYPVTTNDKLTGYKVRNHPKTFHSIANVSNQSDLYGAFRFRAGGKYVLVVEGEEDAHAGYQMFKEYSDYKKSDFVTSVVSITTGAANASKQIANNYEFLNNFEQIIIGFDNDEVGIAGMEKIMQALPKGKVKIATWTKAKDPNEYLEKGLQKQFLADFYNAKTYVPAGVVGSSELYAKLLEGAVVERIPLPPFMNKLAGMLGNIELGTIGIFAAGSGAAKTTVANELLYFWIFNSPHKVGVVSLELTCAQYGQAMLSRHIGNKISRMTDTTEKLKFLSQDNIKQKAQELFLDSDGVDRWMMIDERDGSLEVLQEKIEQLIIACGCKLIILDPLSDLMDGLSIDEQAVFMKWCKSMIKNYNVTFLMIAHIRKSGNNKDAASTGAFIPEEAITGSSTIFKSASWVVMMQRDKYNADEIVKNTTKLTLSKNRSGGETGDAGELYYDNQTHTLHDKNEYMGSNF